MPQKQKTERYVPEHGKKHNAAVSLVQRQNELNKTLQRTMGVNYAQELMFVSKCSLDGEREGAPFAAQRRLEERCAR